MLTDAQELQINSVEKYTHDYSPSIAAREEIDDDVDMEFLDIFEADIAGTYDEDDDLGGICVYFKDSELVAFYDYENFKGAVFA